MRRLLLFLSIALTAASPRPETSLDQVVRKASAYLNSYEAQLGNIVAVEQYVQKTSVKATALRPAARTERRVNSDILMVRDGEGWFPVRCVRNADGIGDNELDYVHKETVAALGARPDARAFRLSMNLPTTSLTVLRDANLRTNSARKVSEEKIGGQVLWKVAFDRKAGDRESSTITLWILPSTGQVFRSTVEVNAAGVVIGGVPDGAFKLRITVEYDANRRFGVLLPVSLQEVLEDPSRTVEGNAEYTYIRRTTATDSPTTPAAATAAPDFAEFKLVVDVPLVSVDVSVNGERGSITDLKTGDFIVEEDGVRQSISTFSPATVPYNVLLLFDWSGSTLSQRSFLQQAAAGFVDYLRPQDWVGIGRFAAVLEMEGWTSVRLQAARRMSELKNVTSSGTNFYTALEQALTNELLPYVGRRRALVVLTDGRDTGYEVDFVAHKLTQSERKEAIQHEAQRYNRLLEILRQERVPIYIVAVSTFDGSLPADAGPELRQAWTDYAKAVDQRLGEIAQVSGGRIVFAKTYEDTIPVYKQLSRELGTTYTLGYYSNAGSAAGYRNIAVKTKDASLTVIQSRSGYQVR